VRLYQAIKAGGGNATLDLYPRQQCEGRRRCVTCFRRQAFESGL